MRWSMSGFTACVGSMFENQEEGRGVEGGGGWGEHSRWMGIDCRLDVCS